MVLQKCSFEPMNMNSWGSNRACCHAVIWLVCVITFTVIHLKDSCLASCQACGAIQGNVRSQVTRIHSLSYKYVGSFVSLSDVSFIYFKRKCTFNVIMRLFSWWKRNVSFFFFKIEVSKIVFVKCLKLFVTVLGLNCLLTGMRRGGFIISNTH